uniref:Carbohydrate kinase, FGGY n=1 Tax=Thermofilum pendens TaxID=2269 RepID=A0A7J3X5I1_THEPE
MVVLAVDVGTSTLKAAVADLEKGLLATYSEEVPIERPELGAAEHNPRVLWEAFQRVVRGVLAQLGGGLEVEALALSGYLFGLIPLSRRGVPLSGVMTWLDRRPARVVPRLLELVEPRELYERTGCPPLYIYQLAKLLWMKTEKPELYDSAHLLLDAKGFILLNLTGEAAMDLSSASGSQLLHSRRLRWDYELLESLGLDPSKLPPLRNSTEVVGELSHSAAEKLQLPSRTPVVAGVFDGAAVVVGEGALESGVASSHLSTSTMLRVVSNEPTVDSSDEMRFQTYYLFDGMWLPGGAVNSGGVVLRWLRDNMGQLEKIVGGSAGLSPYELLSREAERAPPGSEGLLFLPYISGERFPSFGNQASGVLFGLKEHHTRAHVVRALMEGVALNLKIVGEALRENGLSFGEVRITGGGARSRLWLQIIADVLEVPVKAAVGGDAALWGTSLIAWKSLGVVSDIRRAAEERFKPEAIVHPDSRNVEVYRESYRRFKRLLEAVKPLFIESSA